MSEAIGKFIAIIILYAGLGLVTFSGLFIITSIMDWSIPPTPIGLVFAKAVTFVVLFLAFMSGW